ncbi:hypothetical protein ACRRS0_06810 [Agarivorans sp. QJM3NY_29]
MATSQGFCDPHMASEASNTAIVKQLLENTRRFSQGLALLHQI